MNERFIFDFIVKQTPTVNRSQSPKILILFLIVIAYNLFVILFYFYGRYNIPCFIEEIKLTAILF